MSRKDNRFDVDLTGGHFLICLIGNRCYDCTVIRAYDDVITTQLTENGGIAFFKWDRIEAIFEVTPALDQIAEEVKQ